MDIEGQLIVRPGTHFGIVVSRFNDFITKQLLGGCKDTLQRHGASAEHIDVVWVPGSFEVPIAAKRLAEQDKYQAVICLSCVIRGETPHFDYVCTAVTRGVAAAGYETGKPVIFGVLTADTVDQATDRAGVKGGNKGADAARSAIEMVNLLAQISDGNTE